MRISDWSSDVCSSDLWHPADLGALVLDTLVDRSGIDPAVVEDVIMGCVSQVGEQSLQVGRTAVLASSLPESVPAVTIDRQCGSSLQAVHFAAQAVLSGTQAVGIGRGSWRGSGCETG